MEQIETMEESQAVSAGKRRRAVDPEVPANATLSNLLTDFVEPLAFDCVA